ncbi:hypothetical protein PYCCODRAFT_844538 [Trametes coccinea BRFM310]|uniref:Uncharacterized protein n=1 Tax=Trametes coccinea (strain BRFM310) TaxID=1353009 RepID=A0A1Y2IE92_TRAC3|nr:hypothetical protein PYCCODRAFT_844538 [Trametes coccinea BRFM310]
MWRGARRRSLCHVLSWMVRRTGGERAGLAGVEREERAGMEGGRVYMQGTDRRTRRRRGKARWAHKGGLQLPRSQPHALSASAYSGSLPRLPSAPPAAFLCLPHTRSLPALTPLCSSPLHKRLLARLRRRRSLLNARSLLFVRVSSSLVCLASSLCACCTFSRPLPVALIIDAPSFQFCHAGSLLGVLLLWN